MTLLQEKCADTKAVIISRKSNKNRQYHGPKKKDKMQTTIYKTLHRKQKIDQHEPNYHSNNHLQNTTQKTKDWPTRTQLSLKQPFTKHYTENKRLTNTNPTITQTTIYKTLHRKQKIDQHEPNYHSNNHLQNITQKTKDWPTQTPLSRKQPSTKHYTKN